MTQPPQVGPPADDEEVGAGEQHGTVEDVGPTVEDAAAADGWGPAELITELRARRPALPILMLTARSSPHDVSRAKAAGVDDYVVKPFTPRQLRERVENLLAG